MAPLIYQSESYLWLHQGGPCSLQCLHVLGTVGEETGSNMNKDHDDVLHLF